MHLRPVSGSRMPDGAPGEVNSPRLCARPHQGSHLGASSSQIPHSCLPASPRAQPQSSEPWLLDTQGPQLCVGGLLGTKKTSQKRPHVPSLTEPAEGSGDPRRLRLRVDCRGEKPTVPSTRPPCLPAAVPMTVRWVLAVMLVTTLVAMHSHSPWSSLLRARNWRLPLGRALCLLLLGFPTLAKQGGKEEGGSGVGGIGERAERRSRVGRGRREATNTSGSEEPEGSATALHTPCQGALKKSPGPWERGPPEQTPSLQHASRELRDPEVPFSR